MNNNRFETHARITTDTSDSGAESWGTIISGASLLLVSFVLVWATI